MKKKNASYLRINEQKNGLEIHPDSTNNTLDVFVRLMQGYISYSLVKFSRTWNTFQPQEPENAHSKGPKKDSHHGKNKSLENRYIKICSSSICIPDINLPTLKIASFFLTAGENQPIWKIFVRLDHNNPQVSGQKFQCALVQPPRTAPTIFFKPHKSVILFWGYPWIYPLKMCQPLVT